MISVIGTMAQNNIIEVSSRGKLQKILYTSQWTGDNGIKKLKDRVTVTEKCHHLRILNPRFQTRSVLLLE